MVYILAEKALNEILETQENMRWAEHARLEELRRKKNRIGEKLTATNEWKVFRRISKIYHGRGKQPPALVAATNNIIKMINEM